MSIAWRYWSYPLKRTAATEDQIRAEFQQSSLDASGLRGPMFPLCQLYNVAEYHDGPRFCDADFGKFGKVVGTTDLRYSDPTNDELGTYFTIEFKNLNPSTFDAANVQQAAAELMAITTKHTMSAKRLYLTDGLLWMLVECNVCNFVSGTVRLKLYRATNDLRQVAYCLSHSLESACPRPESTEDAEGA
jgi:hypothetical protein